MSPMPTMEPSAAAATMPDTKTKSPFALTLIACGKCPLGLRSLADRICCLFMRSTPSFGRRRFGFGRAWHFAISHQRAPVGKTPRVGAQIAPVGQAARQRLHLALTKAVAQFARQRVRVIRHTIIAAPCKKGHDVEPRGPGP